MNSISIVEYRGLLSAGALPKKRRSCTPGPEELLHRACFEWIDLHVATYPILSWAIHVPNGGKRPKGEAGKMKAMGVKPGVPDILLPMPHNGYAGMAIELKSPTGPVSADQRDWLEEFEARNYCTAVCRELDSFIAVARRFLGVPQIRN